MLLMFELTSFFDIISTRISGADDDDTNNDNPHPQCENSIGDLDLDEYVNTYNNSTTNKTKLIILNTRGVNNNNDNSINNEADVGYDGVPDDDDNDNYGVIL